MAIQNYEDAERLAGPELKRRADQTVQEFNEELNDPDAQYSEAAVIKNEYGVEPTMMGEAYDMNADGLEYWTGVGFVGDDGQQIEEFGIDVRFQLVDAYDYDGFEPGDPEWGVNVSVDVTGYQGEMLGGLTPYNYTEKVWTSDEDELQERLNFLDPSELVAFLFQQAIPDYLNQSLDDVREAEVRTNKGINMSNRNRKPSRIRGPRLRQGIFAEAARQRAAARKKKAQEERQPGQASSTLRRRMGDALADLFDEFGPEIYAETTLALKDVILGTFEQGFSALDATIKEELGKRGIEESRQHIRQWANEIVEDVNHFGLDEVAGTLEDFVGTLAAEFQQPEGEEGEELLEVGEGEIEEVAEEEVEEVPDEEVDLEEEPAEGEDELGLADLGLELPEEEAAAGFGPEGGRRRRPRRRLQRRTAQRPSWRRNRDPQLRRRRWR